MATIQERKEEHIRINLEKDVKASSNPWDGVRLRHNALPEIDLDEVDLRCTLLGRPLRAPILITGMTGGAPEAQRINRNLAVAAAQNGIAMGVGSQRAALKDPGLASTYAVVREYDIPLRLANLGVPQLIEWGPDRSVQGAKEAVEMVDAHALAVHLNFLQESVQPEGDTNAKGGVKAIEHLVNVFRMPILVKETGAGIGANVARALVRSGVQAIDVGGWGGTSFSAVESYRAATAGDEVRERIGRTFWDWGIPTPEAVREVRSAVGDKAQVIATGGIRNGLDAARAIALGANAAGLGGVAFKAASQSAEVATREVALIIEELKTALFLMGCANLDQVWKGGVLF